MKTQHLFLVLCLFFYILGCSAQGPYCVRLEEEVCVNNPEEDCREETKQDCQTVEEILCNPSTKEVCETVKGEDKCSTIEREDCKPVRKEICKPKTETKCNDVEQLVCPEFHRAIPCNCHHHDRRRLLLCQHECHVMVTKKKSCYTEWTKECKTFNRTECSAQTKEECKTVREERCEPTQTTSCRNETSEECSSVPVEKCEDRVETVCETNDNESCSTEVVERFCGDEEEDRLRSLILNGDVMGAAALLTSSENVFSLGAGLTYLPEQNFLITRTNNRSSDPDVVAFQAIAFALLDSADVNKLVNAVLLSFRQDCKCSGRRASEFDAIARGLREDFQDDEYLRQLTDEDFSEFEGRNRRLLGTSVSPVDSFVCAYCAPNRSCSKVWWC